MSDASTNDSESDVKRSQTTYNDSDRVDRCPKRFQTSSNDSEAFRKGRQSMSELVPLISNDLKTTRRFRMGATSEFGRFQPIAYNSMTLICFESEFE